MSAVPRFSPLRENFVASKEVAIEAERAQNEEAEGLRELRSVKNLNKITKITGLLDECKFCQLLRCLYRNNSI